MAEVAIMEAEVMVIGEATIATGTIKAGWITTIT